MLGLFGTLNLAAHSLSTQQEGMAIAGQNLANVNNPAYARQTLVVETSAPYDTPAGQEGTGATVASITEARSAILDNQISAEGSVTGSLTAQQSALQNAESYLNEQISSTSGSDANSPNGLAAGLANLFDSFQSLSANPSDLSTRQAVIQSAQQVATQFNQVSANLSQVRGGLNTAVQNDVAASNQDLSTIASLNQQIAVAEGGGGTANDLVDLREQTIEDLAGRVNITTTPQTNGAVSISIGGTAMVTGSQNVDTLQTYDAGGGQILIQDANSTTPLSVTGGSMGGNIAARDGALANLQSSIDTLASQLITSVNSIYSQGVDAQGGTGQNFFTGTNAATIGVDPGVAANPALFQAGATSAPGDNTTVLALAKLANQTVAGLNNQTITQSYAGAVAALGTAIATATDQLDSSQAVSQMLSNQRSSLGGVSIDQEMTNLMQFQQAYQASAQMVSTINSMMQTLITAMQQTS